MKIEYILDEAALQELGVRVYTVMVDGETILEDLSEHELDALTMCEIKRVAEEAKTLAFEEREAMIEVLEERQLVNAYQQDIIDLYRYER